MPASLDQKIDAAEKIAKWFPIAGLAAIGSATLKTAGLTSTGMFPAWFGFVLGGALIVIGAINFQKADRLREEEMARKRAERKKQKPPAAYGE